MSLLAYKLIHFASLFVMFMAISAAILSNTPQGPSPHKRLLGMVHGLSTTLVIISGFGMIAKLGYKSFPSWVFIKLAVIVLLSLGMILARKKPEKKMIFWWSQLPLALAALYFVIYKPI